MSALVYQQTGSAATTFGRSHRIFGVVQRLRHGTYQTYVMARYLLAAIGVWFGVVVALSIPASTNAVAAPHAAEVATAVPANTGLPDDALPDIALASATPLHSEEFTGGPPHNGLSERSTLGGFCVGLPFAGSAALPWLTVAGLALLVVGSTFVRASDRPLGAAVQW